jgi:sugar (pentulose or hexulose) kinase
VEEVILVGGGARSAFWAQMFADAMGKPIIVPGGTEFGARGAAMLAGVGAGLFANITEASAAMVKPEGEYTPGPASHVYASLYALYRTLYTSAPPLWAQWRDLYEQLHSSYDRDQ